MYDKQRLRPDAQSGQSICLSLDYSMSVKLLTEHPLGFLFLKGGCTGASKTALVKMPHCWKSHVVAYLSVQIWDSKSHAISVLSAYAKMACGDPERNELNGNKMNIFTPKEKFTYFILRSEINAYQKHVKVISITSEMI